MGASRLVLVLLWLLVSLVLAPQTWSKPIMLPLEREIAELIRDTYNDSSDLIVKVEKLPRQLREGTKIQEVEIVRLPQLGKAGLALVEYRGARDKRHSSYVPFRTQTRKTLFYVKRNMTRGEGIDQADVDAKESFIGEKVYQYPEGIDDLQGKVFRRDVQAGTLITNSLLEGRQVVKRGQTVTVIAQNRRLEVRTLGTAVQPGRQGDLIKVKSLSSEKELQGRVIDSGTVAVDF